MRVVFMGTAELACASLEALCRSRFEVLAVVTQPDRPKGRDLRPLPSPVKQVAVRQKLPVLQPERARDPAFVDQLRACRPDIIVVAAYGQILPPAILDLPPLGCVNVHASLLPKYRGAAPIQWAIINDEAETGVTIMKMDPGLDTGPMLATANTAIAPEDDAQSLHERLARLGAELLIATLPDYAAGRITPKLQPAEGVCYARKIKKEDGQIDWALPARAIWNRVRAFTPWPGAFAHLADGRLLKIWRTDVVPDRAGQPGTVLQTDQTAIVIGCGQGALAVRSLQLEGGRRLTVQEFLAGHRLEPGSRLN